MSVAVFAVKLPTYWPFILWGVGLLIGVPLAYRYWRDLHQDDEPLQNADLLSDLVAGDAASKMTKEEFQRVRELLLTGKTSRNAPVRAKEKENAITTTEVGPASHVHPPGFAGDDVPSPPTNSEPAAADAPDSPAAVDHPDPPG